MGLYACGARNELSGRTERAEGVVYLSMEQGRMMIGDHELIVIWANVATKLVKCIATRSPSPHKVATRAQCLS